VAAIRQTETKAVEISGVQQNIGELIEDVSRGGNQILVEKDGKTVAAIISARDWERFRRLEEQRERDFAVLDEIGEAFKGVPAEEIEREVARALADARAKRRAARERIASRP
jgi:prevent-host-death family protein